MKVSTRISLIPAEFALYALTGLVMLLGCWVWTLSPSYAKNNHLPLSDGIKDNLPQACGAIALIATIYVLFTVPHFAWHYHKELWRLTKQGASPQFALRGMVKSIWPYSLMFVLAGLPPLLANLICPELGQILFVVGMAAYVLIFQIMRHMDRFRGPIGVIRGATMLDKQQVDRKVEALHESNDEPTIFWSGLELPERDSAAHFCVLGAPGSGKTITLRLLMQSVLPNIGTRPDFRALVYDAKQDMYSILTGMGVSSDRIRVLNPFDTRSYAWDMAKDVQTEALADDIASILIPESPRDANGFFAKAAKSLLSGAMMVLHERSPGNWTLRDVLVLLSNIPLLKALLEASPVLKPISDSTLNDLDPRLAYNIQATVQNYLKLYRPVAALWHHAWKAGRRLSIAEWCSEDNILLLGNAEQLRTSIDAVNRVIFFLVSQYVLSESKHHSRSRVWFFLDEVKEAGRLDTLQRLITKGRSTGVRVVLGFQDIDGLVSVYGAEAANELTSLCANKAILRLDSLNTSRWASGHIGEAEIILVSNSRNYSREGMSWSQSEQLTKRELVLTSELMNMPLPQDGKFSGYYITPTVGTFTRIIDAAPLLKSVSKDPKHANVNPRPPVEQQLMPWTEDDYGRLKIDPLQPPSDFPVTPGPINEGELPRITLPEV